MSEGFAKLYRIGSSKYSHNPNINSDSIKSQKLLHFEIWKILILYKISENFQPINIRPKISTKSNLTAIEDHLYLVPTPIHQPHQKSSIEADHILTNLQNESPKFLRPTTAFRSTRQRSITLEYMPESHSIILNEYDEDLPKEINPSNFTIGEFVKKRFRWDFWFLIALVD